MTCPRRGRARSRECKRRGEVGAVARSAESGAGRRRAGRATRAAAGRVDVGAKRMISSPPATSMPKRLPLSGGEETERGGGRERDLRLLALTGTEAHARRPVDDRQVCSSRSASVVRIMRAIERAVRFQSIHRESSPASYDRAPATSEPGPLCRPRNSPRSKPSSRRVTSSSSRRSSAALRATGATPFAPNLVGRARSCGVLQAALLTGRDLWHRHGGEHAA